MTMHLVTALAAVVQVTEMYPRSLLPERVTWNRISTQQQLDYNDDWALATNQGQPSTR